MRVPSTDGVTLELHHFGGEGPPLLIAHATGFLAEAYRPMAAVLQQHFEVWAIDFRSHGDSTSADHTAEDGKVSWQGTGRDVSAVVDAIGGGPIFAVGHSMGGASLLTAELMRPGTLTAAYVFEPIIFPGELLTLDVPNPLAESAKRRRPSFPSRMEALHRYAGRPPLGLFRADVLSAYVEHGFRDADDGSVTLKCAPDLEAATFDSADKTPIEDIHPIATPVMVAKGELDPGPGPADLAGPISETLAHGELISYGHLTHFGPLQDPFTIGRDAADFLLRYVS
ncbi:MAG: alpha/beta hydrolase [Acidimicrobiales bacterium]|nr:alpha/beta hydrolase [Acidimicrobiales bacterium]